MPFENVFGLTDREETEMWKDAIFVFDSSAILNFYSLPTETRKKVFGQFSEKLQNRLWMPGHVLFEYKKNREKVISKSVTEYYSPLKDNILKNITTSIKEIGGQLDDLKNSTNKNDKHPHVPQESINDFITSYKSLQNAYKAFDEKFTEQIGHAIDEINRVKAQDDVLDAIEKLFIIGEEYSYTILEKIVNDGDLRYKYKIPPGYKDLDDKDKRGIQIFGDLIIWKQILDYASDVKKPIIFICDDLKEDWCYVDKKNNDRILSPREELIKEVYDSAGIDFWMYSLPQFLFLSNKYIETNIEQENINTLANLIIPSAKKIQYITWGNTQWEASFERLYFGIDDGVGLFHVQNPTFIHQARGSGSIHTDSIINYVSIDNEEYTARCRSYFDPYGKVWFTFLINKKGDSQTVETNSIKFIDWEGNVWNASLSEFNIIIDGLKDIMFKLEKTE